MQKYNKSIVASVGLLALFLKDATGIDIENSTLSEVILSVLTAVGVYSVSNSK